MSQLQRITLTDVHRQGWWQRAADQLRSYWNGPLKSSSPELARLWGGGGKTSAGVSVTEATAMNYSGVWSAVTLIGGDCGSMPLILYKRGANGSRVRYTEHPLYRILHDVANPEMSAQQLRETLTIDALLGGNGYAEIERDQVGRPLALWPLDPGRVSVSRAANGQLLYQVANGNGLVDIPARDMFHLRGPSRDGIMGMSVIAHARETIGLGLATERFGGTFFGNGSTFGGIVTTDTPMTSETSRKALRDALASRHQGVDRAHKLLLLEGGAKFQQVGVDPESAQFLETRLFQITEIARWFNLPPTKLGDLSRATYSNSEQENATYYTGCLRRWLTRWESEIQLKLIAPSERGQQFAEHLVDAILRGDTTTRYAAYAQGRQGGWLCVNDIRRMENLDPVDGGDIFLQPLNMAPVGATTSSDDDRALPVLTAVERRLTNIEREVKRERFPTKECWVKGCGKRTSPYVPDAGYCDEHAPRYKDKEGLVLTDVERVRQQDDPRLARLNRAQLSLKAAQDAQAQRVEAWMTRYQILGDVARFYPSYAQLLKQERGWPDRTRPDDDREIVILRRLIARWRRAAEREKAS